MGGLAHYLESAGLATTQISLVRLHTETIRPPRALWVSFELGRPFGPPGDAAFQKRVLHAALSLLERTTGPILEDFPEDAPALGTADEGWACPVNFAPAPAELSGVAALAAGFRHEFNRLLPWYERAVDTRGRTTVGASPANLEQLRDYFADTVSSEGNPGALGDVHGADAVRLAAEDLKAFYFEAATAQPGAVSSAQLTQWFWHETHAGQILRTLRERYSGSNDAALALLGQLLLVPRVALD